MESMMQDLPMSTASREKGQCDGTAVLPFHEPVTLKEKQNNGGQTMSKASKEIISNMEFLIRELHKEWDRPGAVKASVCISMEEAGEVSRRIARHIEFMQNEIETQDMTFTESICKSRECYVVLRMAKKIKDMEDKTNKKGDKMEFVVALDKEELKLFKELIPDFFE